MATPAAAFDAALRAAVRFWGPDWAIDALVFVTKMRFANLDRVQPDEARFSERFRREPR